MQNFVCGVLHWLCERLGCVEADPPGGDLVSLGTYVPITDIDVIWTAVPAGDHYAAVDADDDEYVTTQLNQAREHYNLDFLGAMVGRLDVSLRAQLDDPSEKSARLRVSLVILGIKFNDAPYTLDYPYGYQDFTGYDFGGYGVKGVATKAWIIPGGIFDSGLGVYIEYIDPGPNPASKYPAPYAG